MDERSLYRDRPRWPIGGSGQSKRPNARPVAFLCLTLVMILVCNGCGAADVANTNTDNFPTTYPGIFVSPTSINFGSIRVGASSPLYPIVVMSIGDAPLVLSKWDSNFPFQGYYLYLPTTTCTNGLVLAPGQSCHLDVYYQPAIAGALGGQLYIYSNATPNPYPVNFSGTGYY